jgi:hypothetical protein
MITRSHQQESLGIAYLQAVAAIAGYNNSISRIFDYKVDGSFHQVIKIKRQFEENGYTLDYQLKSTYDFTIEDDQIKYDLDAKNYNHLVRRANNPGSTRMILILFCMPREPTEWVDLSPEQLIIKYSCYWDQISGDEIPNTSTKTIRIDREQRLTGDSLKEIFEKISRGETDLC